MVWVPLSFKVKLVSGRGNFTLFLIIFKQQNPFFCDHCFWVAGDRLQYGASFTVQFPFFPHQVIYIWYIILLWNQVNGESTSTRSDNIYFQLRKLLAVDSIGVQRFYGPIRGPTPHSTNHQRLLFRQPAILTSYHESSDTYGHQLVDVSVVRRAQPCRVVAYRYPVPVHMTPKYRTAPHFGMERMWRLET